MRKVEDCWEERQARLIRRREWEGEERVRYECWEGRRRRRGEEEKKKEGRRRRREREKERKKERWE